MTNIQAKGYFHVEYKVAADGGVWTVFSPNGVSVHRTSSIEDADRVARERNAIHGIVV